MAFATAIASSAAEVLDRLAANRACADGHCVGRIGAGDTEVATDSPFVVERVIARAELGADAAGNRRGAGDRHRVVAFTRAKIDVAVDRTGDVELVVTA